MSFLLKSLILKTLFLVEWNTFKQEFLSNNVQITPHDIKNIKICSLANDKEVGFVSPESKKVLILK